jgi:hypothetical protein
MHECKQDKVIEYIAKRLDNIDSKIDSLLAYKWQIMGGAGVIGALLAVLSKYIF